MIKNYPGQKDHIYIKSTVHEIRAKSLCVQYVNAFVRVESTS